MKVSIQRQCDGMHPDLGDPNETCDARIEIHLDIPERACSKNWDTAYAAACVALGWRRIGGPGGEISIGTPEAVNIVPDTKRWIVCGVHATGTECARCGFASCSCVGGPLFDVRVP